MPFHDVTTAMFIFHRAERVTIVCIYFKYIYFKLLITIAIATMLLSVVSGGIICRRRKGLLCMYWRDVTDDLLRQIEEKRGE